ncbi:MAG: hypothetical protein ACXWEY_10790 [Bacteroidia bacterium]
MNKLKWLFVIFPVCALLFSFSLQYSALKALYEQQWITRQYGDPALEIASPETLQPINLEVPEQVKKYVVKMGTYQYQHDALLIMANSVGYKPEVTASLQGAANGSINEMKNRPGVEDFSYIEKTQTISGQEGIIQTGSFRKGEDVLDFHNIITVKGANMWQVFVAYHNGDAYGLKIKEKVLNSIKI